MAFRINTINPLDINPSTGVGVSLNYATGGVFETTYTTAQATKNNLINYLLTGRGVRYLNPTFGFGLQEYLFEQLNENTVNALEQDIQSAITQFFPTVTITNLTVDLLQDTNQLDIKLSFTIAGQEDTINITLG
jgi:phage baseplate assembly protein W